MGLRTLRSSEGRSVEGDGAGRFCRAEAEWAAWPRVTLSAAVKKAADFIKFWWGLIRLTVGTGELFEKNCKIFEC